MALGLGVLGLPPAQFWAMSLPELNAALDGLTGAAWGLDPIDRHEFGALMARYPDNQERQES